MNSKLETRNPKPERSELTPPSDRVLSAPSPVRVKVCGITSQRDVDAAVRFYADAVGFVFAPESSRRVTPEEAGALSRRAAERSASWARGPIDRFGVFVNAGPDEVLRTARAADLSVAQLHGEESPEQVAELLARAPDLRIVKAFRVDGPDALERLAAYPGCWAYLLDAYVPGRRGGTGKRFDWDLAARAALGSRIILAGGLTPDNVAEAVRTVRPFMVDVSGGVEENPRRKDHNFLLSFLNESRVASRESRVMGLPTRDSRLATRDSGETQA